MSEWEPRVHLIETFDGTVERIVYHGPLPIIHRAEDDTLAMEWRGDPRQTVVARHLVEEWVEEHNELVRCRKKLQAVREAVQKEKRFWAGFTHATAPPIVKLIESALDA